MEDKNKNVDTRSYAEGIEKKNGHRFDSYRRFIIIIMSLSAPPIVRYELRGTR